MSGYLQSPWFPLSLQCCRTCTFSPAQTIQPPVYLHQPFVGLAPASPPIVPFLVPRPIFFPQFAHAPTVPFGPVAAFPRSSLPPQANLASYQQSPSSPESFHKLPPHGTACIQPEQSVVRGCDVAHRDRGFDDRRCNSAISDGCEVGHNSSGGYVFDHSNECGYVVDHDNNCGNGVIHSNNNDGYVVNHNSDDEYGAGFHEDGVGHNGHDDWCSGGGSSHEAGCNFSGVCDIVDHSRDSGNDVDPGIDGDNGPSGNNGDGVGHDFDDGVTGLGADAGDKTKNRSRWEVPVETDDKQHVDKNSGDEFEVSDETLNDCNGDDNLVAPALPKLDVGHRKNSDFEPLKEDNGNEPDVASYDKSGNDDTTSEQRSREKHETVDSTDCEVILRVQRNAAKDECIIVPSNNENSSSDKGFTPMEYADAVKIFKPKNVAFGANGKWR